MYVFICCIYARCCPHAPCPAPRENSAHGVVRSIPILILGVCGGQVSRCVACFYRHSVILPSCRYHYGLGLGGTAFALCVMFFVRHSAVPCPPGHCPTSDAVVEQGRKARAEAEAVAEAENREKNAACTHAAGAKSQRQVTGGEHVPHCMSCISAQCGPVISAPV